MKRTNILLSDSQHRKLKRFSRQQGRTLGELVRTAVDEAYGERDDLEERRRVAVEAYRQGFISLGKLGEVLGLDPVGARAYLKKAAIPLQVQGMDEILQDAVNA